MTNRLSKSLLLAVTFLLCSNFSQQQMNEVKEQPIIFYGKLTLANKEKLDVENISIGGRYDDIRFYFKPQTTDVDPTHFGFRKVSLKDVKSIVPQHKGDLPVFETYLNRDFLDVTITWRDEKRKPENYLIERDKQVYAYDGGFAKIKKDNLRFRLESLLNLEINDYKCRDTVEHAAKEKIKKILDTLDAAVKEIKPETSQTKIQTIVDELQKTFRELAS